jgi:hypothetical protein
MADRAPRRGAGGLQWRGADHHDIIEDDPLHHYEGNVDPHGEIVRLEALIEELTAVSRKSEDAVGVLTKTVPIIVLGHPKTNAVDYTHSNASIVTERVEMP